MIEKLILRLLVAMAIWMMDSRAADYRTRITWQRLKDAIAAAERELEK